MFIINALDDYGVQTRIVVGCYDLASNTFHALDSCGFTVSMSEGEAPQRDPDEMQRAQGLITHLYSKDSAQ